MLSVLVGPLVEVTATDPTGFDGDAESVSITVIMKFVPVPTGVLAVSGLIVVAVVRAVTVTLADAVLPVPPLVEVTAAVVLLFRPVAVPFTFTEKVHEALAASVALKAMPVSETVLATGLVMVKLRPVVAFTGIEAVPNALLMLGGATTD